jgi:hypothetical protein
MAPLFTALAWCFLAIALLFFLGLHPRLAKHFYPGSPRVARRAAAPVLFALLSVACFQGFGLPALVVLTVAGIVLIARSRRHPPQSERLKQRY